MARISRTGQLHGQVAVVAVPNVGLKLADQPTRYVGGTRDVGRERAHAGVNAESKMNAKRMLRIGAMVSCLVVLSGRAGGWAMEESWIPVAAPEDGVMASPAHAGEVGEWAAAAFTGKAPNAPAGRVRLEGQFAAYQLHRPDLDAGLVLAFRRPECDLMGIIAGLRGLRPEGTYEVEFIDEAREKRTERMTGRELLASGLELRLPERGTSLVVRYAPSRSRRSR